MVFVRYAGASTSDPSNQSNKKADSGLGRAEDVTVMLRFWTVMINLIKICAALRKLQSHMRIGWGFCHTCMFGVSVNGLLPGKGLLQCHF